MTEAGIPTVGSLFWHLFDEQRWDGKKEWSTGLAGFRVG
jgi:hypothetical protein